MHQSYLCPSAEGILPRASELLQSGSPASANGLSGTSWGGNVDDLPVEELPHPSVKSDRSTSGWDEW